MRWRVLMVFAATLVWPAVAQEGDTPIIVEGQRSDEAQTLKDVRSLSYDFSGNVARFETPVCPGVVGMSNALANELVQRMRDNAKEVEVRLAPPGCAPNLTLIVSRDGAALIKGLLRNSPQLFDATSKRTLEELRRAKGPVWAWQTTEPKRADGMAVSMLDQSAPGRTRGSNRPYAVSNAKMSRLASTVRQDFGLSFVVISRAAVEGKTITQLADYALLRGLAAINPVAEASLGSKSIAGLFTSDPPAAWTEFDRAYIKSLYSGSNGYTSEQKMRQIAQDVKRTLKQ